MIIKLLWAGVFLLVAVCVLLLFLSITAQAVAQAAMGAMVAAFVVCLYVAMRAIEAMAAPSARRDAED